MIFVTIGTQEPFDRLIKAVDHLAGKIPGVEVVAQVSKMEYIPKNLKTFDFLTPKEFDNYFNSASLIIAHAGMGTIISALVGNKPIVVMPRLMKYSEHRSDHQLDTANEFKKLDYIYVAQDEVELEKIFNDFILTGTISVKHNLNDYASSDLINSLRDAIGLK